MKEGSRSAFVLITIIAVYFYQHQTHRSRHIHITKQVCPPRNARTENVRWPRRVLRPGESLWVSVTHQDVARTRPAYIFVRVLRGKTYWPDRQAEGRIDARPLHYDGCVAQLLERWSLTGELSLSLARPVPDRWPHMWVSRPLYVSQLGQLSLSSFRGR